MPWVQSRQLFQPGVKPGHRLEGVDLAVFANFVQGNRGEISKVRPDVYECRARMQKFLQKQPNLRLILVERKPLHSWIQICIERELDRPNPQCPLRRHRALKMPADPNFCLSKK